MLDNADTKQLKQDLILLQNLGIINTPEYWLETAPRVKYLPKLLNKIANSLKYID